MIAVVPPLKIYWWIPVYARGDYARAWRMAQHTGELSFSTEANEGVLGVRRIATQPWMLMRQTVKDSRLSGATIRYTAEL
ncbi:MAG: hypothetical protein CM15mP89_4510 [Gammaproteobacteria bacterium]|nr:MAG: hypothetical protein CM15mP89_4510 [Gammaproteobacteria bacterium]